MDIEDQKLLLKNVGKFVADQMRPLKEEIATLKAQVAALEEHGIKFVGSYQRPQTYTRGDCVTHDGGMWVATCATPPQEVPGKSVCWQLSVKSPRDRPRLPTSGRASPQPEQRRP